MNLWNLKCRHCGNEMKDFTHRIDDDSDERILWCSFCGTLFTPNRKDTEASEDWRIPQIAE